MPLEALEKIIAAGGGDSSLAAEKIALETTKPGQLRPTFGVAAPFESVLVAGEKAFQGIETRRRVEDEAPLTFASTPDARANRIALSGVDRSIRSLEKSKDFDKIHAKLVERKRLQLSLLKGEIAFEKKRQEEATGGKAKATIQTRIDNLREKVLTTEEKFANDKEAANLKELRLQEQRQLDSLRALKVRAEAELTNPFFSDYEGIRAIQEDYEAALKALVEAVRKRADAENLGEVKTQEQVDAIEKGAQSIREFVQLYQKIIAASEQYLDSVNKLLASDAVFADTDVALSVERRRRGIREPAEKRIGLLNERLVQSRGSLEVRQGNRAEILQKLNDFDPAQGEDARNQLLAQLAASSESLRTLRDEVAALELDVQAASLDMHGAMRDAFDLTGIMSDLRLNVEDSIRTLSTDIRAIFSDTFDGMASDFADALFAGGGERAQSFLKDITDRFETFFKNLGKRLAESLFKKAVFGLVDLVVPSLTKSDENGNSTIGNLLGFKGDKSSVKDTVTVNGKTVIVNGPTAGGTREKSAKEHNAEVLAGIEPSPLFSGAISKVSGKDEKEAFGGDIPLPEVEKEAFGGDIPLPVGKDAPADAKEYFDNLFGGDNEESLPNLPASGVAGNKELLSDLPPPPAPSALLAGLNRAAAAEEAEEEAAGFFNTITTGWGKATTAIADGLSVMGTSISGLLQGLFGDGKGGQLAQIGLSAAGLGTGAVLKSLKFGRGGFVSRTGEIVKAGAGQVFGASFSKVLPDALKAATGADSVSLGAAIRRTHGGIIKGPGTTTSDSIPGVIVDSAGQPQRGILVSNDESILNGEATAALGAPFVNWINKNADRFANGGMISKSHSMGAVASSVSSSTRTARPSSTPSPDFGDLADAITSSMEGTSPQTLSLEVDDGALNRTLGDYLEGYFADVIATR